MKSTGRHTIGGAVLFAAATGLVGSGQLVEAQRPPAGTATVKLTAEGVTVSGEYPTTLCGGPYMLGKGMAYQTKADDWRITVASESRTAGNVPLNTANGINVVVTVTRPGKNYVRGPRNAGSLEVSSDFRKAEATFDLRNVVGKDTATLIVTFTCASG